MFKKENRLTKKKDFDRIFRLGRASYNKILGVRALENSLKKNRFGVIVSGKVSKKAVERNRLKRQIKAILKEENNRLKTGIDCVVVALPPIKEVNYNLIKRSIFAQLKKIGLYNK